MNHYTLTARFYYVTVKEGVKTELRYRFFGYYSFDLLLPFVHGCRFITIYLKSYFEMIKHFSYDLRYTIWLWWSQP